MILALDAGNTNICIGCIDHQGNVGFVARLSTDQGKTMDEYAVLFRNIFLLYRVDPEKIEDAILSSVVPPITSSLKEAVRLLTGKTPLVIGPGVKSGLNIMIDNPAQLGSDLVVDAVAGIYQYSAPLAIIDMGTATTICVIDRQKRYLGGLILPGVRISQAALTGQTAQLPKIGLEAPEKVIGRNTIDGMKSGVIFGNAAMLDGLIDRIEDELGEPVTAIATGGLAGSIVPHCRRKIICDNDLLLKGLLLIYEKTRGIPHQMPCRP